MSNEVTNPDLRQTAVIGSKPTAFEKNNLPLDVRYLYHKGVELYQCIRNYELGILDHEEFTKDMRKIEERYK